LQNGKNVKKEWNDAAESWIDFVRCRKDYYRDVLNNPAAFKLIGNIRGQVILDLACGEGHNTRILAKKGGVVVGIDFSEKMIEYARQEEVRKKLGIRYYVMGASNINKYKFSDNHFDLITCFMSLQDIEDYKTAIAEVARVLKYRGRFVFSIPHPCFETIILEGNRIKAAERYFGTVRYPIQWKMKRLVKPFKTTSFHRTLTDYSQALSKSNLFVSRLVEPKPTEKGLKKCPQLKEVLLRPQSIVIESVKLQKHENVILFGDKPVWVRLDLSNASQRHQPFSPSERFGNLLIGYD